MMTLFLILVVGVWLVCAVPMTIVSEVKAWALLLYWALYWGWLGPYLVSLDDSLAVALGFALFFVGLRFTLPPIGRWLEKDL